MILLEVAPGGVCSVLTLPSTRVVSYTTISPLPTFAVATRQTSVGRPPSLTPEGLAGHSLERSESEGWRYVSVALFVVLDLVREIFT